MNLKDMGISAECNLITWKQERPDVRLELASVDKRAVSRIEVREPDRIALTIEHGVKSRHPFIADDERGLRAAPTFQEPGGMKNWTAWSLPDSKKMKFTGRFPDSFFSPPNQTRSGP